MLIQKIVGFEGESVFDSENPDGTPKKLLDITRLNELAWKAAYALEQGIKDTYRVYLSEEGDLRWHWVENAARCQ